MDGHSFVLQVNFLFLKFYLFFCLIIDLTDENIYKYFINNQQTSGHQSLIFGIRELNSIEIINYCLNNSGRNTLPITDQSFYFTSNYQLRIYTSGCYYLDQNNNWKSDGLIVSVFSFLQDRIQLCTFMDSSVASTDYILTRHASNPKVRVQSFSVNL
jgi:hypothetical protein